MNDDARQTALREVAFCEQVLAKSGLTILSETLRDAPDVTMWTHYPPGEVYDPDTGAQWFYHAHAIGSDAAEHGHFHCFVRPDGAEGPLHHLCAVGVDPHGRLRRLFTVNQWVVGDDWLDAEATIALLPRFDVHMPRPSYLVNRWLTAVFSAHEEEIAALIRQRDAAIDRHRPPAGVAARADKGLEVAAEVDLAAARPRR